MKFCLTLASAFLLITSAVSAQTVTPAVPGTQVVVTPDMRDGGSPRAPRRDEKVPGLDRRDQKKLRKLGKVKSSSDGTMKTKTD